jgi:hypothetical protein
MKTDTYYIPDFPLTTSPNSISIADTVRDYVTYSLSHFTTTDCVTGKYVRYLPQNYGHYPKNLIKDWKTRVIIGDMKEDCGLVVIVDSKKLFRGSWEKQLDSALNEIIKTANERRKCAV